MVSDEMRNSYCEMLHRLDKVYTSHRRGQGKRKTYPQKPEYSPRFGCFANYCLEVVLDLGNNSWECHIAQKLLGVSWKASDSDTVTAKGGELLSFGGKVVAVTSPRPR